MSTLTAPEMTIDIADAEAVPFGRLVTVELRKSYDTRSGFWLLAFMGILTGVIYAIMLLMSAFGNDVRFSFDDFAGAAGAGTSVLLPVLGILLVTSEWSQRTAMTTFTLETNRGRVLLAKLVTGLILTLAVVVFAVAAGALANLLYAGVTGSATWSFGWTGLVGFLITQVLAMLGGFALATLLLNSPAAIVAFFAYKWIVPTIFMLVGGMVGWFQDALPWIDFQSAQMPLYDLSVNGAEWGHLFSTGLFWLGLPFVLGLWRVLRAEVK
jgi:ABC-type transport system involved in multi-copper enzyme maturation permease subunit